MLIKIKRVLMRHLYWKRSLARNTLCLPENYKKCAKPYIHIQDDGTIQLGNSAASLTLTASGDIVLRGKNIWLN